MKYQHGVLSDNNIITIYDIPVHIKYCKSKQFIIHVTKTIMNNIYLQIVLFILQIQILQKKYVYIFNCRCAYDYVEHIRNVFPTLLI